jgi:hypothetical protein
VELDKKDKLIYDLIFSDMTIFEINIADYINDIYEYKEFVSDIKKILKKSKVLITYSKVDVNIKTAMWSLEVKK